MKLNRIESTSQTAFGTRFGTRLTRLLEDNKDILTNENRRNLSNIRNNGLNSILELEDASVHDKQMFNFKYVLRLHSDNVDKKNELMNLGESLYRNFRDYITGSRINGRTVAADNGLPVQIKDMKGDTDYFVLQAFSDRYNLPDKIEKEIKQADVIVKAFNKFSEDWYRKLNG